MVQSYRAASIKTDLPTGVGPGAKLDVALLVVEGKPGDVDLASGLEQPGRDVEAAASAAHHNISLVSSVKLFISTGGRIFLIVCFYYGLCLKDKPWSSCHSTRRSLSDVLIEQGGSNMYAMDCNCLK